MNSKYAIHWPKSFLGFHLSRGQNGTPLAQHGISFTIWPFSSFPAIFSEKSSFGNSSVDSLACCELSAFSQPQSSTTSQINGVIIHLLPHSQAFSDLSPSLPFYTSEIKCLHSFPFLLPLLLSLCNIHGHSCKLWNTKVDLWGKTEASNGVNVMMCHLTDRSFPVGCHVLRALKSGGLLFFVPCCNPSTCNRAYPIAGAQ